MNIVKGIFNKKFIFFYSFLLLLIVFLYFNNRYDKEEITYAIIYIFFGIMISLFYILKDYIYSPDRLNYKQVIMEDALFNHKGEIIEEFEAYPLYHEFVTFHLNRKSEDPYRDTVTSIQAVKYINNKMVDSLFIPIDPSDPLLKKYTVPLNEGIGRFLRYAGDLPIIIYNQPFTHTYLNVKLDKEVHISFIDAMKMSKDLYGITNKPLSHIQKYLRLYNLSSDQVAGAKVIGAIYLDYIYTVSKYRTKQARIMSRKGHKMTVQPLPEKAPEAIKLTSSEKKTDLVKVTSSKKPEIIKSSASEEKAVIKLNSSDKKAEVIKSTISDSQPKTDVIEKETKTDIIEKTNTKDTSFKFDTKVAEEEKRIVPHSDSKEWKHEIKNDLNRFGKSLRHIIADSSSQLQKKLNHKEDTVKSNEQDPKN